MIYCAALGFSLLVWVLYDYGPWIDLAGSAAGLGGVMQEIAIGTHYRLIDEGEQFTFEEKSQDATGKKKWDTCQWMSGGGSIKVPYLLMVELVRAAKAEAERAKQQGLIEEEKREAPPVVRPVLTRRIVAGR
jgi:hypothetical protein